MKPDTTSHDSDKPASFIGAMLAPLAPLYGLGMWWRLRQRPIKVNAKVISYGNLTAGGTGKTPAVIERAAHEVASGKKVAILTRGYGGSLQGGPHVYTGGGASWKVAAIIGDEPALIAQRVPEVVIVKGANRVASANLAITQHGCDTLIMDDGYQHVRLARDENHLLIDAANPFGNGHLVPKGILREPISAMNRATSITITRCDQARDLDALMKAIETHCPGVPVRKTRHTPSRLWRVCDGEERSLDSLQGAQVKALCAIGNPAAFHETVTSLGAQISDAVTLPDHQPIPPAHLTGDLVITTEKDAVRMKDCPANVYALAITLEDIA
jgi:tetraacyldisaccharide 4'-kinase